MTVATSTNRVDYTGNGSTTVFPFTFRIFAATDLVVTSATPAGVETQLVLNTDYTVSGAGSYNGGSVTLGSALASGDTITIQRVLDITQETDLRNQGAFFAETHEDVFDRLVMVGQQLQEQIDRCAKLPVTNTTDTQNLVEDIIILADALSNLNTIVANLADITTVADDLNEVVSEIETVANSIANVNTVGAAIAAVNTVAAAIANVNTVATNIANVNTVAGISANVTSVAGNATNINAVASNATNITAVAGNATNINAVAGNATNINAVNANSANINAVAGNATNVNTVATNIASVNTAASNIAAIIAAPSEAAAAAASAAAAAAAAASGMYSSVQDKSANYTVVAADAGDLIRVTTTAGAVTITLPAISTQEDGFKVAVAKWSGDNNAVTVQRSGPDLINGSATYVLDAQYKSATFVADFETSEWFAAGTGGGGTNIVVDSFDGTGSQTAFTLSGDPGSENNTQVFISGVYQEKDTYSVSGTTLNFSEAAPSGTSNIEVVWSIPLAIGTPADGTVSTQKLADSAVTTSKIASQAVTIDKLASSAIVTTSTFIDQSALLSGSVTSLVVPDIKVVVNGSLISIAATTLALGTAGNWDNSSFATAANRAGKDFYLYALEAGGVILSNNSTFPTGYTATNSRKIGGFHCLCVAVGTISGHTLTGYAAGNILPRSVWDLYNKSSARQEGTVYSRSGVWVDIYLPSVSGSTLVSVNNGTIADGTSSPAFHCYKFEQWFARQGMKTISQLEFFAASEGANQGTNITGSADPGTTTGHTDTAGRRMISNEGVEDICGALWQWCRDQGGVVTSAAWANAYDGNDSGVGGQHYQAPYRGRLGGGWNAGAICGSRG